MVGHSERDPRLNRLGPTSRPASVDVPPNARRLRPWSTFQIFLGVCGWDGDFALRVSRQLSAYPGGRSSSDHGRLYTEGILFESRWRHSPEQLPRRDGAQVSDLPGRRSGPVYDNAVYQPRHHSAIVKLLSVLDLAGSENSVLEGQSTMCRIEVPLFFAKDYTESV